LDAAFGREEDHPGECDLSSVHLAACAARSERSSSPGRICDPWGPLEVPEQGRALPSGRPNPTIDDISPPRAVNRPKQSSPGCCGRMPELLRGSCRWRTRLTYKRLSAVMAVVCISRVIQPRPTHWCIVKLVRADVDSLPEQETTSTRRSGPNSERRVFILAG